MPFHVNEVQMDGNLGSDPEFRQVGESTVASFRIANNNGYRNKAGEWVEKTIWMRVKTWNHMAQDLQAFGLRKGDCVLVTGKLEEEVWSDKKTGEKRSAVVINASVVAVMPPRFDAKPKGQPVKAGGPPVTPDFEGHPATPDDDCPF